MKQFTWTFLLQSSCANNMLVVMQKRAVNLKYLFPLVLEGVFVEHFFNVNVNILIGGGKYVFQNSVAMLFKPTSTMKVVN